MCEFGQLYGQRVPAGAYASAEALLADQASEVRLLVLDIELGMSASSSPSTSCGKGVQPFISSVLTSISTLARLVPGAAAYSKTDAGSASH
jgi:hypothetical protein